MSSCLKTPVLPVWVLGAKATVSAERCRLMECSETGVSTLGNTSADGGLPSAMGEQLIKHAWWPCCPQTPPARPCQSPRPTVPWSAGSLRRIPTSQIAGEQVSSCQGGASCGLDFQSNLEPVCSQERGGVLGEGCRCPQNHPSRIWGSCELVFVGTTSPQKCAPCRPWPFCQPCAANAWWYFWQRPCLGGNCGCKPRFLLGVSQLPKVLAGGQL